MKAHKFLFTVALILFYSSFFAQETDSGSLQKLTEGNKRFAEGKLLHQNQLPQRRIETANGQNPFAVILSCSDSRVPPEIIFDQGLGDLFVIRTAGEVVDDFELASIEYAVEHLHVELIVVLGHEKCGAVDAAVKGGELPGHLGKLISEIEPAVKQAKKQEGDLLTNAVHENIFRVVKQLKNSEPIIKELVEHNHLQIKGAYYDLDDGKVNFEKQ
ncbi:MAG: carbonic anhydrase [Ignavibacteriales bacterium]|nr:carbonic anhydrase [Ignavibacteriales bacterium]